MTATPSVWALPNYRRLWSARVVTRFGSALSYVVLLWLTYTETRSALAVAYVGLAEFIPTIAVGLFSGALVDRFDRRRTVVISNLGRSAAMAGLVLALYALGFHLVLILAAAVLFSIAATFFGPGSQSLLPEIVPRGKLAEANGYFEAAESAVGVAGNGLAGILIVLVGALPSLGIDAVGYLFGALLVATIVVAGTSPRPARAATEPLWKEAMQGFAYLRRAVALLELTIAALVLNFLFSFILTFLVVYSTDLLHGGAVVYAALEAVLTAGSGLGGLAAGRLGLTRYTGRIWAIAMLAQGVAVAVLVVVPVLGVAVAIFAGVGISQGLLNVTWLSTVQATVPEELQGRYFATDNMVSYAAIPASQILGGILITLVGVSVTFLLAGLSLLGSGAVFLSLRELRQLGYAPPASPS